VKHLIDRASITDDELRTAYAKTWLARDGMTYDKAITIPGIRQTLIGAVDAARRRAMRQSLANPNHYAQG
jgi:hypothetical protein